MIAKNFDTYTTIARIEFDTLRGKEVECNVKRFGSLSGVTKIFKGTSDCLMISFLDGLDTFEPIKASEATLKVHNLEDFAALGILARGNRDYLLEVKYEGSIIWTGFMQPDQWTEPFTDTPYPSEFRFIDGLSLLKDIDFADSQGCYYRGYFRDIITVGYCISEIRLNRPIIDQINIIDQNTDEPDIAGTLFEKIKNVEAFRGMTCYEVLQNILRSYFARIEFSDNKYYIRRLNANEQERSYTWQINPGGVPSLQGVTNESLQEEITCANEPEESRIAWVDNTQELFRLPGYEKLSIKQGYGVKPSIFPRSLFEECDFDSNDNLRYWNHNGIRKRTVDGDPVVEFKEFIRPLPGQPLPYDPPAFIEAFTDTAYSGTGVTDETADFFELDFTCRSRGYVPFEAGVYNAPRRPSGTLTSSGNSVEPATGQFESRPTHPFRVHDLSGTLCFRLQRTEVTDVGADFPEVEDRWAVIFRNEQRVPQGYQAGVPYWAVVLSFDATFVYIRLNETKSLFETKNPNADDVGEDFSASIFFSALPVRFQEPKGADLIMTGTFLTNGRLPIEINRRDIYNSRFFAIGAESNVRILGGSSTNGPLFLRVEKITENFIDADRQVSGAWQLEGLRVRIKDTPENREDVYLINDKNRGEYNLNIMFAETPIKNNFQNNVLKFYNNFLVRTNTTEPALQYIHGVEEDSEPFTMYDFLKSNYTTLLKDHRIGLAGTLFSDNLVLTGKIFVENFTEKRYIATENQWNVGMHETQIVLHEIAPADPPELKGSYSESYSNAYDK